MLFFTGVVTWLFELIEKGILTLSVNPDEATLLSLRSVVAVGQNEWESSSDRRKQPMTSVFKVNKALQYLEERATLSVRKAWKLSSNSDLLNIDMLMSDSCFCDVIYIPELEMHTKVLSDRAIESLNVDLEHISTQNMGNFREFIYCLKQERARLNKSRCQLFDRCWGIGPDQRFVRETTYPFRSVDVLIKQEMDTSSSHYSAMLEIFEALSFQCKQLNNNCFDVIAGTRLLHFFVLDLLGRQRTASAVYRSALGEGYVIVIVFLLIFYAFY